jgi:cell division protease FtsH
VNPPRNRYSIIYLLLFVAIIAMVVYNFQQQATIQEALTISEVAADIRAGNITRIIEDENRLRVIYSNGTERTSQKEATATLVEQLVSFGVTADQLQPDNVKIEIRPPSAWLGIATALGYILPFLILAGVFWFVFRQAQGSNNAAMSFGKSRARMFTGDQPTVTFDDVAGVEEAKEELYSLVLQEQAKRLWQKLFLVKQGCHSFPSLVLNSLKCLSALAPAE